MMDSADEKYLRQLYYNPKYSTAFSSATKLWQYIKLHGRNITRKELYEWLSKQDVYTSHHPILHRFARRRVITRGPLHQEYMHHGTWKLNQIYLTCKLLFK